MLNNTDEILASRLAFAPIFYCTNMRTYILKSAPLTREEVISFLIIRRRTKMWAHPGVLSDEQWQQICRTLDKLEEVITQYALY